MPVPAAIARPTRADEYRRRARRLRATLAAHPARLQRKLRDLADRHDGPAAAANRSQPIPTPSHDRRARAFAEEVASRMDGPVLRYSQRRELLAVAQRTGIGRFEANLIIAAVRHRQVENHSSEAAPGDSAPRRAFSLAPVLVVLTVESIIASGIWQICSA